MRLADTRTALRRRKGSFVYDSLTLILSFKLRFGVWRRRCSGGRAGRWCAARRAGRSGGWGIGGQQRSKQPAVDLGLEDGHALPCGGGAVGVGAFEAFDEAIEA